MPMESIVSDALNRLSSGPGATWKITVPSAMMAVVISSEPRSLLNALAAARAIVVATMGTNALVTPNTGMNTKLCSLKYTPNTENSRLGGKR